MVNGLDDLAAVRDLPIAIKYLEIVANPPGTVYAVIDRIEAMPGSFFRSCGKIGK